MINKNKGFSLIELLAVCLIIAILSSLALPSYRRSVERTRVAEALTLLRSIYDSCERLSWENGKDNCFAGIEDGTVTFRKLDVVMKGTFANNGLTLNTDNFTYTLASSGLTATSVKGQHIGSGVSYDGRIFSCLTTQGNQEENQQACQDWGQVTWNEGGN